MGASAGPKEGSEEVISDKVISMIVLGCDVGGK
jgi:hypothetical protein